MDKVAPVLSELAERLSDRYHEPVFVQAGKEFQVAPERRRYFRAKVVEDGLLVWLPFAGPDEYWFALRRRSMFTKDWTDLAEPAELERRAANVLTSWAGLAGPR